MTKISIYVEGYTEVAFVRELLLRYYQWTDLEINCLQITAGEFSPTDYDWPTGNEDFHVDNGNRKFQIVDCGGDSVSSKILARESYLVNNGFQKVVGLRDVYSLEFRKNVSPIYDELKVNKYISFNKEILDSSSKSNICNICFAVMEVEAWYLAMPRIFSEKSSDQLNEQVINGLYPESLPEHIFKPANTIDQAYNIVGEEYKKKQTQVDALSNYPTLEDYKALYELASCQSFNEFCNSIGLTF